jgi:hypothetical protein
MTFSGWLSTTRLRDKFLPTAADEQKESHHQRSPNQQQRSHRLTHSIFEVNNEMYLKPLSLHKKLSNTRK